MYPLSYGVQAHLGWRLLVLPGLHQMGVRERWEAPRQSPGGYLRIPHHSQRRSGAVPAQGPGCRAESVCRTSGLSHEIPGGAQEHKERAEVFEEHRNRSALWPRAYGLGVRRSAWYVEFSARLFNCNNNVPGIIQNEQPDIIKLVEDLVASCIKGNCLILVTLPMSGTPAACSLRSPFLTSRDVDDIENQQAARMAQDADPSGQRTIGL